MIEKIQDLFLTIDNPNTATCITTNGTVNRNGYNIMGGGTALLARNKYPNCDRFLGELIIKNGNIVQQFWTNPTLIAFPTKNNVMYDSILELIRQSAIQLKEWANNNLKYTTIILPRPGVALGGLNYKDVKPILEEILTDDKFVVIDKA